MKNLTKKELEKIFKHILSKASNLDKWDVKHSAYMNLLHIKSIVQEVLDEPISSCDCHKLKDILK